MQAWVPEWATPDLHERLLTEIDVSASAPPRSVHPVPGRKTAPCLVALVKRRVMSVQRRLDCEVVSAMFPDECQVLTQDVQAHLQARAWAAARYVVRGSGMARSACPMDVSVADQIPCECRPGPAQRWHYIAPILRPAAKYGFGRLALYIPAPP